MPRTAILICDMCGKKAARVRRVTRSFGRRSDVFLIEDLPVIVCRACGESYLTSKTFHKVERLRLHRKSIGIAREILVVRFGGAS